MGGGGKSHSSAMGHVGMGPSGFARMSPGLSRSAVGNPSSLARVGVAHPRMGRHHRHHNRFFAFAGGYYPYSYYDSCYERIWTRWGWRVTYVCGDY
jgi:hypothetical protein